MAGNTTWNGLELAVIGMACRFPGARGTEEFWRNLRDGVESITFLSESELEPSALEPPALRKSPQYVRAAAVIDGADQFDAAFFGITPKEAEVMDPQQRVFLECAWTALESAGYDPERYRDRIGVYAGARTNTYVFNLFSNPAALGMLGAFEVGLGNDLAFLSTRVSHRLNLRGPAYSLHTACSTSLVAIHLAGQALTAGECRMALAGGVAIQTPQRTGYPYQFGGVASPDGHCRAFDAKAQGTLFGNGAGVVVLKRLVDALEDGDTIHAVIRGSAINNDGSQKASFNAPSTQGQARVIRDALLASEVDARSITYVEAHGTGTQLGDPIEVNALTRAFRTSTQETGFCALSSVKPNIGHLDAAAGIASFIKAVLALKHRQLPPTLHFETPNPQIDFASSPFFVNATLRAWEPGPHPRRAGVSSFGFGGTNAHVILEEAPPVESTADARPWHLLPLSAKTDTALEAVTEGLAAHLEKHPEQPLDDVAYTLQVGRQFFAHRRIAVVRDREHAIHVLRGGEPERLASQKQEARGRPVAFLFPGVGTQHMGMAAGLYRTEPVFREAVDEVAGVLRPLLGVDLRTLLYQEPAREVPELARTSLAMPAIFLTEYALARLWMAWGVEPEQMLGHSLGEYAAACVAGVLSVEDAAALVALRGQLMDELPRGGMVSISLPEAQVLPLLGQELDLAAVNAASQCVVSGPAAAVTKLAEELAARGVEHRRLHVEAATHSRMLDPILPRFLERVSRMTLRPPERPYISSLTGKPVTGDEVTRPQYWVDHLRRPVRFQDGMQVLLSDPARVLLEVGPGQSLTALARLQGEPAGSRTIISSSRHAKDPRPDESVLMNALGRLWLAGVEVDWDAVHAPGSRRRIPLPTYPFEGQRFFVAPMERSAALASQAGLPGKLPDVADWFHLPSWRRTPPAALEPAALAQTRCWVVFTDGGLLASRLVERLEGAGQHVVTVHAGSAFQRESERRFTVSPDVPADYAALLTALQTLPARPEVFVHLWSLTPQGEHESALARFKALQPRGYYSLVHLGQALAAVPPLGPVRVEVVSNHLLDPDGQMEALPEKAPLLSACQGLCQTQRNVLARGIDVVLPGHDDLSALAGQLFAELTTEPRDLRVALRGARRWVQELSPVRLTETSAPVRPLRERGVYLITGGLGRVGLLLAGHLARTKQARLALVGRTPLPPRRLWDDWMATQGDDDEASQLIQRVRELEAGGAEVLVLSADVSNPLWMREVLSRVDERFGTLHGVLHCADLPLGPPARGAPAASELDASEARFRAKVWGTYVLEDVLRGRALDFVLLFSSSAAMLTPFGGSPTAAANHFLDAFAAHRSRGSSTSWVSVAWDPWPQASEAGAARDPDLQAYAMTVDEGLTAFQRVIDRGLDGPVLVATGDVPQRLAAWLQRAASPAQPKAPRQRRGDEEPPANELERFIANLWQEILGVEQVGRNVDFFALGGHSLLATQIVGRLRSRFQVDLPLARLFESPTVAGLATAVAGLQVQRQEPLYRELLERVTRLSEMELAEELRRRGVMAA